MKSSDNVTPGEIQDRPVSLAVSFQELEDRRETMTAKTRTTPHRHFSQITDRSDVPQPAAIAALPSAMGSFDDGTIGLLLLIGEVWLGTSEGCEADGEGGRGCTKVRVADRGLVVGPSPGCEDEVDGLPRSFCPILGRSRSVGVQYCM